MKYDSIHQLITELLDEMQIPFKDQGNRLHISNMVYFQLDASNPARAMLVSPYNIADPCNTTFILSEDGFVQPTLKIRKELLYARKREQVYLSYEKRLLEFFSESKLIVSTVKNSSGLVVNFGIDKNDPLAQLRVSVSHTAERCAGTLQDKHAFKVRFAWHGSELEALVNPHTDIGLSDAMQVYLTYSAHDLDDYPFRNEWSETHQRYRKLFVVRPDQVPQIIGTAAMNAISVRKETVKWEVKLIADPLNLSRQLPEVSKITEQDFYLFDMGTFE